MTFATGGLLGIAAIVAVIVSTDGWRRSALSVRLGQLALLPIYGLVALLVIEPQVPSFLGLRVTGLEAEGLVVTALVFAGVNLAWALFTEPRVTPGKPADSSSTKEV